MNSIRNNVQLIGRLGAKADYKTVKGDTPMVKLNLATNEVYKNSKGEKVEDTYWHNLVAFGKPAEIIHKYTDKGSEICIHGKLINRSYEDKDGQKKYITEVQINDVLLMGDKAKH